MVKDMGIKKIYASEMKKNEELRTKLKESDTKLAELKKLYERQLKWEETGEMLKHEMEKYKTGKSRKAKAQNTANVEQSVLDAQGGWEHEEREQEQPI